MHPNIIRFFYVTAGGVWTVAIEHITPLLAMFFATLVAELITRYRNRSLSRSNYVKKQVEEQLKKYIDEYENSLKR